jgi:hypothetical protein
MLRPLPRALDHIPLLDRLRVLGCPRLALHLEPRWIAPASIGRMSRFADDALGSQLAQALV